MTYSLVGLLAIAITVIINRDALWARDERFPIPARKEYLAFVLSIVCFFVTDALWGLLDELRVTVAEYADTVLFFIALLASAILWMRYIVAYINDNSGFAKALKIIGAVIFALEIAALIVNAFVPIIFWFDSDGLYHAGIARNMTLVLQSALFLLTFIYALTSRKESEQMSKRLRTIVFMFALTMIVLIGIQMFFPLLPLNTVGYLLAVCLLHTFVLEDEKNEYSRKLEELLEKERIQEQELGSAIKKIYTDPLTGAASKQAYMEDAALINKRVRDGVSGEWAAAVFDLNDLKQINDTLGHDIGDIMIYSAYLMIQEYFAHSKVYRIGGDEFAIILEGEDYDDRVELLTSFNKQIEDNLGSDRAVVASGMSRYRFGEDKNFRTVFERADRQMYRRKAQLKEMKKARNR